MKTKDHSKQEGLTNMMIVAFLIGAVLGHLFGYCFGFKAQEKVSHDKNSV